MSGSFAFSRDTQRDALSASANGKIAIQTGLQRAGERSAGHVTHPSLPGRSRGRRPTPTCAGVELSPAEAAKRWTRANSSTNQWTVPWEWLRLVSAGYLYRESTLD